MGGDKPIGLAIGVVLLVLLVLLPGLIPPVFYLFANVYAIVAGSDFGSETIAVGILLTGLVLTVTMLVLLPAGVAALIGRALSPRRREADGD
ncbi:MAG TPA: hypothetical protein VE669_04110 [Actinomycetota bacterium]|jgi:hypothetical protein|nr:hypothetical protein [Actinomycetota bacterium]